MHLQKSVRDTSQLQSDNCVYVVTMFIINILNLPKPESSLRFTGYDAMSPGTTATAHDFYDFYQGTVVSTSHASRRTRAATQKSLEGYTARMESTTTQKPMFKGLTWVSL